MATMQWTFGEVYTKVSEFLGLGDSPAGDNLAKVKDLVYRGYMSFLMPFNAESGETYIWEYLKKETTLNLVADQYIYALPTDYHKMTRRPAYGETQHYPLLQHVSTQELMHHRNGTSVSTYPNEYSLRVTDYDPTQQQTKEMLVWPTPDSDYELNYSYMFIPEKPTLDSHYFIGGVLESEAILESCLAAAELEQDEKPGVHAGNAQQLIQQLIQADQLEAPDTVGNVRDGNIGSMSIFTYRIFQIPPTLQSVYGA